MFPLIRQALVNRVSIASKEHNSTMYALTFIIKNTIIMIYSIIFTNSFYIFYVINSGILSMDVFPVASWDELNARVCPGATRGPREISWIVTVSAHATANQLLSPSIFLQIFTAD